MLTTDSTMPEIMQNAEFVVIQFDLTKKERIKRALKTGGLVAAGTFATVLIAGTAAKFVTNETPEED